jgi:NitT/TauT family transport system substrate-binding protein
MQRFYQSVKNIGSFWQWRRLRGRLTWVLAIFVASLVVLGSCAPAPSPPLKVGTVLWPGYDRLYLAKDLGYYDKTPIQFVNYASTEAAVRAFRNGEIEAVATTMGDALTLAESQPDVRMILTTDTSTGADVIMAQPTIAGLAELKGRQVGVEATALGSFMLKRAFDTVRLSPQDVKIVRLGNSEHTQAYKQKTVDAVITYEPFRSELVAVGAKQLFDSSQIPNEIVDVISVRQAAVTQRQADLQRLVNGWFRADADFQKDPQAAAERLAPRNQITPAEYLVAAKGLHTPSLVESRKWLGDPQSVVMRAARQMVQVMVKDGFLQKAIDPASLVDDRFLKKVSL